MTNKSHVSVGYEVCPVCGLEHSETVLLDKRLQDTLDPRTCTGQSFCPEHQKLKDEGYIAMVELDGPNAKTARRTGRLAHVRASAWNNIFNAPVPPQGICYVEVGVLRKLEVQNVPDA